MNKIRTSLLLLALSSCSTMEKKKPVNLFGGQLSPPITITSVLAIERGSEQSILLNNTGTPQNVPWMCRGGTIIEIHYDISGTPGCMRVDLLLRTSSLRVNTVMISEPPLLDLYLVSSKADLDSDGDVDQEDFAIIQGTLSSQDPGFVALCDLNDDHIIDNADMDIFNEIASGPGVQALNVIEFSANPPLSPPAK